MKGMPEILDENTTDEMLDKPDGTPPGFVPKHLSDEELLAKHGPYEPYPDGLTDND